jgi:hypothetical protein
MQISNSSESRRLLDISTSSISTEEDYYPPTALERVHELALSCMFNCSRSICSLLGILEVPLSSSVSQDSSNQASFLSIWAGIRLSPCLKGLLTKEQVISLLQLDKWRASTLENTEIARTRIYDAWKNNHHTLSLRGLDIVSVPPCLFTHLFPSLKELDLSYNSISHLQGLERSRFLSRVDVSFNPIDYLSLSDLSKNDNIKFVDSYFSSLELESPKDGLLLTGINYLAFLDLGLDAWIESSSGDVDEACRRILDCFENKRPSLDLNFLGLSKLPESLSSERFPNLVQLSLSGNNLVNLDGLEKCINLSHLDVSFNQLVNMEGALPLFFHNLVSFYYHNNPIQIHPVQARQLLQSFRSELGLLSKSDSLLKFDIRPLTDKEPIRIYNWLIAVLKSADWNFSNCRSELSLKILRLLRFSLENPTYQQMFFEKIQEPLSNFNGDCFKMLEWMEPPTDLFFQGKGLERLEQVLKNAWEIGRERLDLTEFNCHVIPDHLLPYLRGVRNLSLRIGSLSDLNWLYACPDLVSLTVTNNKLTSTHGLRYCPRIERLNLEGNEISDLSDLSTLKSLKYLNLSSNKIEDYKEIAKCKNLCILQINNNLNVNISELEKLENLMYLSTQGHHNRIRKVPKIKKYNS